MPNADDYRSRISKALEYARSHLDENPSLADLASAAAFSPFHFHRIFAAATGETPAEHVRRLRLEKAANQLRFRPAAQIGDIALDCGFPTASAFSRDFKARFGRTPQAYRKNPSGAAARPRSAAPLDFSGESVDYRFERVDALRLAYCSHIGPYGPGVGKAWAELMRWAAPRGLAGPDARVYGISWDNPDITDDGKKRYDACLAVPSGIEGNEKIRIRTLPACRCIVLPFKGPERQFSRAYSRLYYRILPETACDPADFPAFERYLSMPKGLLRRRFDAEIYLPIRD